MRKKEKREEVRERRDQRAKISERIEKKFKDKNEKGKCAMFVQRIEVKRNMKDGNEKKRLKRKGNKMKTMKAEGFYENI